MALNLKSLLSRLVTYLTPVSEVTRNFGSYASAINYLYYRENAASSLLNKGYRSCNTGLIGWQEVTVTGFTNPWLVWYDGYNTSAASRSIEKVNALYVGPWTGATYTTLTRRGGSSNKTAGGWTGGIYGTLPSTLTTFFDTTKQIAVFATVAHKDTESIHGYFDGSQLILNYIKPNSSALDSEDSLQIYLWQVK